MPHANSRKIFDPCNSPGQRDLVGPADNRKAYSLKQEPSHDYETDALGFFKGLWWVIKFWLIVALVLYFAVRVAG
jgi:hypothetical protein